ATGDFDVSTITGEKTDPAGKRIYICKTPLGAVKEIPADELIDAHAQKNASAMFPDKDQAALVQWYVDNDKTDCPVDSAKVSLMEVAEESGAEVQFELEALISHQIDALENELKQLNANDP